MQSTKARQSKVHETTTPSIAIRSLSNQIQKIILQTQYIPSIRIHRPRKPIFTPPPSDIHVRRCPRLPSSRIHRRTPAAAARLGKRKLAAIHHIRRAPRRKRDLRPHQHPQTTRQPHRSRIRHGKGGRIQGSCVSQRHGRWGWGSEVT